MTNKNDWITWRNLFVLKLVRFFTHCRRVKKRANFKTNKFLQAFSRCYIVFTLMFCNNGKKCRCLHYAIIVSCNLKVTLILKDFFWFLTPLIRKGFSHRTIDLFSWIETRFRLQGKVWNKKIVKWFWKVLHIWS